MAASGAAAAAEAPAFLLPHLNDDELEVIARALADSLAPHVAVALASTCRGLRAPTAAVVAELRRRHEAVKALCAKEENGTHWTAVRDAEVLDWFSKGLTAKTVSSRPHASDFASASPACSSSGSACRPGAPVLRCFHPRNPSKKHTLPVSAGAKPR